MKDSPVSMTSNELHSALNDHRDAPSAAVSSPQALSPADAKLDDIYSTPTFDSIPASRLLQSSRFGSTESDYYDDKVSEESLSPEKVMDLERHVTQVGQSEVYIDMDNVPLEFIEKVKKCALCLGIMSQMTFELGRSQSFDSLGQAGIVAVDGKSYFITAKHNVTAAEKPNEVVTFINAIMEGRQPPFDNIVFPEMNCEIHGNAVLLRNDAIWKRGVDITRGEELSVEVMGQRVFDLFSRHGQFELIRKDFQYAVNQMVGIAVYCRHSVRYGTAVKGSTFNLRRRR
jgi:hypothetical protein